MDMTTTTRPDDALDPATMTFLLVGKLPSPHERAGVAAVAPLFKGGPRAWAEAWTRHETALRQFAAERGLRPGRAARFYGEAIAAREQRLRGRR
jgi:hypothetical protein